MANQYTNIPDNAPYHYSWHQNNQIVVGYGAGPGQHRNFTCNISNQFAVTLAAGLGGIPLGDINTGALRTSVTSALKLRFRNLIHTAAFNDIGRTAQQLTFRNNQVVNRHTSRNIRINTTTVEPGRSRVFANNVTMRGFIVYRNLTGSDTYYRNYDIRETANAADGERLRVLVNPVKLEGTVTQDYRIQLLQ
jgi:hypothetical protein